VPPAYPSPTDSQKAAIYGETPFVKSLRKNTSFSLTISTKTGILRGSKIESISENQLGVIPWQIQHKPENELYQLAFLNCVFETRHQKFSCSIRIYEQARFPSS